ncbi:PHP domain-containing protein [Humibacter sp.]|jgi:predicted metal-dependent phosphoesterase TrpH|uniref:PHP domain-containing protein n=1 Tax=Humibacter sp. TaxID=1940291 RepID=UPI002B6D3A61|nr:PHP domain-containing protein [Humibacter sp.]HVX09313.1 PHP domain-containing protein [Humibacter sp.]
MADDPRDFRAPIDLHTHSSASDGTESPDELVRAAAGAGLGTVALTDHDSTAGWADAAEAASEVGITFIPGMELSTRYGWKSVHMLAYLFDPTDEPLTAELERIREARRNRAETMVTRLSADYDLTWADVVAHTAPGATVGRPHIADALVTRGVVPDRSAAFETLLHPRGGYYEPIYAPTPLDGVRLIRGAGGVPVLAHPATRGRDGIIQDDYLQRLVDSGLAGLELDHRENTDDGKEALEALAERYGLILTGSSDYHGAGKPNRLGENTTTPAALARILDESAYLARTA